MKEAQAKECIVNVASYAKCVRKPIRMTEFNVKTVRFASCSGSCSYVACRELGTKFISYGEVKNFYCNFHFGFVKGDLDKRALISRRVVLWRKNREP